MGSYTPHEEYTYCRCLLCVSSKIKRSFFSKSSRISKFGCAVRMTTLNISHMLFAVNKEQIRMYVSLIMGVVINDDRSGISSIYQGKRWIL